jgi:hypothetical protein
MSVRNEVREFIAMGPLPDEASAEVPQLKRLQEAIERIGEPVTHEEAELLIGAFGPGPDTCFGLAWAVLHLIESAGADVITAKPPPEANEWVRRLWDRAERGRGRGWK